MVTAQNEALLDSLQTCAALCNRCAIACLGEANISELADCITLDLDCAQVCGLVANLVSRQSQFVNRLLVICGDICQACAEECSKHAQMEHCRICAEACENCAEQCSQLIVK